MKMRKKYIQRIALLLTFCLFCVSIKVVAQQKTVIKVDLNETGRKAAETNENGYTPWIVKPGNSDSLTINGVKIKLVKTSSKTGELSSDWYKTGMGAPSFARLISDGITIKEDDGKAKMEMHIKGLPSGKNTILTYHNVIHSPETGNFSPVNIYVNGKWAQKITPSVRAVQKPDAASAYITVDVKKNQEVILLFEAADSDAQDIKNIIINGFEINTPNAKLQSRLPFPANADEHVVLENNHLQLKWKGAPNVKSHDVYFGTDASKVANASHHSKEFKGNTSDTLFQTQNLYSMHTYYWRVDEVSKEGITKGDIWYFRPAQIAFPNAEGYGRFARGGRGGKVVEVTNLNDSGPGSLREAVTTNIGPKTIVFAVSGLIELKSRLVLSQPYVTIAGQTAPGKGICIKSSPFGFTGNDVVVRNLRVRLGAGETADGMGLTGANYSIVDHCSISWTIDEAFSSRGAHNITLQRTLISEALNAAGHKNYEKGKMHGFAASIGGDVGSFHHNLLAHCYGRNWSLAGGLNGNGYYSGKLDIRNNVVYNWGSRATDGGAKEVNFVNNYYKPGAGTTMFYAFNGQHENVGKGMQRCYFDGNIMPGYFDEHNQQEGRKASYSNGDTTSYQTFVSQPFFNSYVTTQSATNAYKMVLSDVGNNQPVFDDHDKRIIEETLAGTYSTKGSVTGKPGFPDHQNDVGGYENYPEIHRIASWDSDHDGLPDWWEKFHKLNIHSDKGDFSDANSDKDQDGYTQLDNYLEWMAQPHYTASSDEKINLNLKDLAKGYTDKPSFVIGKVINGKVKLKEDMLEFSPEIDGLGSFEFTVKDKDGDTMTRKVNILSGYSFNK